MAGTFRLIFLGAGFSRQAGLPLGSELFQEVRRLNAATYGRDNHLERDLSRFLEYLEVCEERCETPNSVNYEEFLGFLDVEHYLGLRGKDTWSSEGNESQLMIRRGIAQVLYKRTPAEVPAAYRRFAGQLSETDCVLTFNYDTLLESVLEAEGIPYRLFPFRYKETGWICNVVDSSRKELKVLKLHGSINWFDRSVYDERVKTAAEAPLPYEPEHAVFGPKRIVDPVPLTDGPRNEDDPLAVIFRVPDIGPLVGRRSWDWCPLILAPSQTKILYGRALRELWWGLEGEGGYCLSLGVVGYSLPLYDAYVRQVLYHVFSNYTGFEPDLEYGGRRKTKIRIIDYRSGAESVTELRDRYRFADWSRTELRLDGFNAESVDWFLR